MNFSAIQDLEAATESFGLLVSGNALAPTIQHGQYVVIQPAAALVNVRLKPGHIVLAAIREKTVSIMRFNADGDLVDGADGYVPAGQWRALGLVTGVMTVLVE